MGHLALSAQSPRPQALRAANANGYWPDLGCGGVGEAVKQLNKQARKNPQVNRGWGRLTGHLLVNVEQGLKGSAGDP